MDAGHERSKWRMKCMSCILFILLLIRHTYAIPNPENGPGDETSQECAEDEYSNTNGTCCNKCPPGFKLREECQGKNMRSNCEKCKNGTYIDKTNFFHNCFECHTCSTDEYQESPCTHTSDIVCACKPDYYYQKKEAFRWTCVRCKKCGEGEKIVQECAGKKNTQCECKDLHYRVDGNLCKPCNNCSEKCPDVCVPMLPTKTPRTRQDIFLIATIAVLGAILCIFAGYSIWRKKKGTLLIPNSEKLSSVLTISKPDESFDESSEKLESEKMLPDCVPRELKIHEFFYFVMGEIPVNRFKELMRRLNVSEQDIDRAMKDNSCFADAQYQMLKVWSDKSPGNVKNILPRKVLQEFLDRLRDMNLNSCAEGVENKFCTEG